MNAKENVEKALFMQGRQLAQTLQVSAKDMTGTELNERKDYAPLFTEAVKRMNMLNRPVGFVCRSSVGRVVKLLQPYDSDIYPGEPETLEAQWGFVWSTDPEHALPFVALSTSPYMKGNVCEDGGAVYRSKIDNNVFRPSEYPDGWEKPDGR